MSQLNLYRVVIDDKMRHESDNETIGLLLVKDKNNLVVEYSLSGYDKPIGVASWEQQINQALPKEIASTLPSIEELEHELHHLIDGDALHREIETTLAEQKHEKSE